MSGAADDDALVARANAAIAADDLDGAIAAMQALLARHTGNATLAARLAMLHNNRGSRHAQSGRLGEAAADWDAALRLDPRLVLARLNRARLQAADRQWREVVALLEPAHVQALHDDEIALDLAEARVHVALDGDAPAELRAAIARARASGAVDALRLAAACAVLGDEITARALLASAPAGLKPALWQDVAVHWRDAGDRELVRLPYARARQLGDEGVRLIVGACLATPSLHRERADIDAARQDFATGMSALAAALTPKRLVESKASLDDLAWSNVALAFHGRPDRELLAPFGDWLAASAAAVAPTPVREGPRARRAGLPRVGIVMPSWRHTAMTGYFAAWPLALAEAGIDCTLVSLDARADMASAALAQRVGRHLACTGTLADIAVALHAQAFDLLLYPDAGVDPRCVVLASLRLARVQACGWGHPDTTGLPTLDAYFTCAAMEPPDAATHYREPLRALPQLGTRYGAPPPADAAALAQSLGSAQLPGGRRYLVPHVAPKLHVDFDAVLADAAAADPHGTILLVGMDSLGARALLHERIGAAMRAVGADPDRQLRFLPRVPHAAFIALCEICDVMLDPPHWSGGANAYDALASGLPVVTMPGALMRGRQAMAMTRALGLADDLCVPGTQDLAARAVAIARDRDRREHLRDALLRRRDALFLADEAMRVFVAHVRELVG